MELRDAIRKRRMTRNFSSAKEEAKSLGREELDRALLKELLELARHAPSAGYSQGVEFLVLEAEQVSKLWDITLSSEKRASFPWPGLLNAPVVVIPLADSRAYLSRYSEPDKAKSGLGSSSERWAVPYWIVDCAFATQNLLLLAEEQGLGALFFGFFEHTEAVKNFLHLPEGIEPIGAVALGWPAKTATEKTPQNRKSSSAKRPRRKINEIIHWGAYSKSNN